MTTTLIPIIAGIAAAILVLALTPATSWLARRLGAVDEPSDRRIHRTPTPRLGGLAIVAGFMLPVLWLVPGDPGTRALLAGAVLIALVGAIDDVWGLSPPIKLLGQMACATLPVAAGLTIDHVTLPLVGVFDLGPAQYPLSVLWFVAIVNMINFIDGMDGLAAGVGGIGAITFAILASSLGRADAAVMAAALAGACIAFLAFNFHPARVFMGDTGALFIGFVLAGVAVSGVMKSAAAIAVLAPLIVLAIPILDTSFVILRRLKHGLPVYGADRSHFHHRFFTIGWSQRRTVLTLYGWCSLMAGFALATRFISWDSADGVRPLGVLALGLIGLLAILASLYLVAVLEILKWRNTPVIKLVRGGREERERVRAVTRERTRA